MHGVIPRLFFELLRQDNYLMRFSLDFLDATSKVLRDNQVVFFRNYTDHGLSHIERLLIDATRIIPKEALATLTPIDACVIVTSSFLHDLALHLSEASFAEVVSGRFVTEQSPLLPDGTVIEGDRPWNTLWEEYLLEAIRWDNTQNARVFGPGFARPDRSQYTALYAVTPETRYDDIFGKPLVGEFIRRHHARLAHEIALAGFPGTSRQEFSALAERDFELADLVGFVARSHHVEIRVAAEHVDKQYHGDLVPLGCHVAYCMAVLRIADYLQLDDVRAPTLLLRLRSPQSPLSIDEWRKHAAVRSASFTHSDPESIYFPVRQDHSYHTHLLLHQLFDGLQRELDLTASTLRQVYRNHPDLHALRLKYSRIRSNLYEANFGKRLPYVPTQINPTVDSKLLSLLVDPLYEKRPECGIRELIQNAIDAVLEREQHEAAKGTANSHSDLQSDIVVRVEEIDDRWILSIADKGIGMTLSVIRDCFLRAGVSFRDTKEWKSAFTDMSGAEVVRRSGKFGVGAFAAFLLGDTVHVETRHVADSEGYSFTFSLASVEVEVQRKPNLRVGTTIRIPLSSYAVEQLEILDVSQNERLGWDWFTLDHPNVRREIVSKDKTTPLKQEVTSPIAFEYAAGPWRKLSQSTYHDVFWSIDRAQPGLTCNGIKIGKCELSDRSDGKGGRGRISSGTIKIAQEPPALLGVPPLAIIDYSGAVPITLQRHTLEGSIPDELGKDLRSDMALDFVAYCMACAPKAPFGEGIASPEYSEWYPFLSHNKWFFVQPADNDIDLTDSDQFVWCHTDNEVLPLMPNAASTLNFSSIIFQGSATQSLITSFRPSLLSYRRQNALNCYVKDHADQFPFRFANRVPCHFPLATRILRQLIDEKYTDFGCVRSAWCLLIGNIAEWKQMNAVFGTNIASLETVEEDGATGLYTFKGAEIDRAVLDGVNQLRAIPLEMKQGLPSILIVINLDQRAAPANAKTPIESTWLKIIGSRGIPFSTEKREELIREVTSSNARLASYYHSWREFEPAYRASARKRI